jgi:hypothetical protein
MNPNQVTATIYETSERAADWRGIFHRLDNIPLWGPLPQLLHVPEKGEVLAYFLDLSAITNDERERLVAYIAGRFNLPHNEVARDLHQVGCPVLAEELLVTVPTGVALSMMYDVYAEIDEVYAELGLDENDDDDDEGWLDEQLRPLGFGDEDDDDDDF